MKQCPVCRRAYTDDALSFCLEDGSALSAISADAVRFDSDAATQPLPGVRYTSSAPTMLVAPAPFVSAPRIAAETAPTTSNRWIIFAILGLLLLIAGGGIITFLVFIGNNKESAANENKSIENKSIVSVENSSVIENIKDAPVTPMPVTATQMVGTWRTSVHENGLRQDIIYTFNADGTSKVVLKDKRGRTLGTEYNLWQYSDAVLYETFSNGSKAKGSIKWIDYDNFEITIIDNGVPAYNGIKRNYERVN